jgi:hypothetical protein
MRRHFIQLAVIGALATATAATAAAQGHILIFTNDGPTEGFNDPTPATPAPGNPGVTKGQQRTYVFLYAAAIWEQVLKPTNDIYVIAAFNPLGANVLGSAGTQFVHRIFAGAELPDTWYHDAIADQLAGTDLNPCCFDIGATFSSNFNFYFGTDNNDPPGTVDLLPVVIHELGHGLGFANFANEATGTLFQNGKDVYSEYTLDTTTNKLWNNMTNAERQASAIRVRKISWNGVNVNKDVPKVLAFGEPNVTVLSPAVLGVLPIGPAAFGAPISSPGVTGDIALGTYVNAAGQTISDGCSPLTSNVAGKIALMDRGVCTFTVKVKNAQNAGAIAALIADNVQDSPPPGLGGADPTITITSGRIALNDGNSIKANLATGTVRVTIGVDLSVRAGTDHSLGLMLVAALNPVALGSSISHWDTIATPNQLMEPAINLDLGQSVAPPADLTSSLMTDIGWFSDHDGVPDGKDDCIGSDIRPTVQIDDCDSGVNNVVFTTGCSITDLVNRCEIGAKNHGKYVSCVAQLTNILKGAGWIDGAGKGAIQSCAAHH